MHLIVDKWFRRLRDRDGSMLILTCVDGSLVLLVLSVLLPDEWLLGVLFVKVRDVQIHRVYLLDGVHFAGSDTAWGLSVCADILGAVAELVAMSGVHIGCGTTAQVDWVVTLLASGGVLLRSGDHLSVVGTAHWTILRLPNEVLVKVKSCMVELEVREFRCISRRLVLLVLWPNIIRVVGGCHSANLIHHLAVNRVAWCHHNGLMLPVTSSGGSRSLGHWVRVVVVLRGVVYTLVPPVTGVHGWLIAIFLAIFLISDQIISLYQRVVNYCAELLIVISHLELAPTVLGPLVLLATAFALIHLDGSPCIILRGVVDLLRLLLVLRLVHLGSHLLAVLDSMASDHLVLRVLRRSMGVPMGDRHVHAILRGLLGKLRLVSHVLGVLKVWGSNSLRPIIIIRVVLLLAVICLTCVWYRL